MGNSIRRTSFIITVIVVVFALISIPMPLGIVHFTDKEMPVIQFDKPINPVGNEVAKGALSCE